jgi:hypothetical protein
MRSAGHIGHIGNATDKYEQKQMVDIPISVTGSK